MLVNTVKDESSITIFDNFNKSINNNCNQTGEIMQLYTTLHFVSTANGWIKKCIRDAEVNTRNC
jgi:hypothetical protein